MRVERSIMEPTKRRRKSEGTRSAFVLLVLMQSAGEIGWFLHSLTVCAGVWELRVNTF